MIVIDASVLIKLFHEEDDSNTARDAIRGLMTDGRPVGAPTLVVYEVLAAALHYAVPFRIPLRLLTDLAQSGFQLVEPTVRELLLAERISTARNEQWGYPGLQDATYHAMAITRKGVFVTADRKHFNRASSFGSLSMLADWQAA